MMNPYKKCLDKYFETITDFKHSLNRLNQVLLNDVAKYTEVDATYFLGTALIIGDWTGPTDNGWKTNFHTGVRKTTLKENYANEIEKVLSIEFGLAYSQCYEALETLLKDLIHLKIESDKTFKCLWFDDKEYSREHLKGGEEIFKLVKKAGGGRFKKYSKENASNFRFKEMFKVFSEVRHSIIHSKGVFKTSRLPGNEYYKMLFEFLLPLNKFEGEFIPLKFEYKVVDRILIYLAEFGYQIFKILSEEDNYEWNYKEHQPKFEISNSL